MPFVKTGDWTWRRYPYPYNFLFQGKAAPQPAPRLLPAAAAKGIGDCGCGCKGAGTCGGGDGHSHGVGLFESMDFNTWGLPEYAAIGFGLYIVSSIIGDTNRGVQRVRRYKAAAKRGWQAGVKVGRGA